MQKLLSGTVALSLGLCAPTALGQTDVAWDQAVSGDWDDPARWNPATVPNNGLPLVTDTYDAIINAVGSPYTVTLDFNVTIENFLIDSPDATLQHSSGVLQANAGIDLIDGGYLLSGGTIANSTINQTGFSLDYSSSSSNILSGVTVNGDLVLDDLSERVRLQNGTTFGNVQLTGNSTILAYEQTGVIDGLVNLDGSGSRLSVEGDHTLTLGSTAQVNLNGTNSILSSAFFNSAGTQTLVNQGTITADGSGTRTINPDVFTNQGTVLAQNGVTLTINPTDALINAAGAAYGVDDGEIQIGNGSATLTLPTGTLLFGSGLIDATVVTGGTVSPGSSAGELRFDDGLVLQDSSQTIIEIGGPLAGDTFDWINVLDGAADIDGQLIVSFINRFVPETADTFDILVASEGVTGTFSNASDGSQVLVTGGGQFEINYLVDRVRLSNFVPEPGAGLLLFWATGVLVCRRGHRAGPSDAA